MGAFARRASKLDKVWALLQRLVRRRRMECAKTVRSASPSHGRAEDCRYNSILGLESSKAALEPFSSDDTKTHHLSKLQEQQEQITSLKPKVLQPPWICVSTVQEFLALLLPVPYPRQALNRVVPGWPVHLVLLCSPKVDVALHV